MSSASEKARAKAERMRGGGEPAATPTTPTTAPSAPPERSKDVRVTLDLKPPLHADFSDFLRDAARQLGRSRVTAADVLRVLVRRVLRDPDLRAQVLTDLRDQ